MLRNSLLTLQKLDIIKDCTVQLRERQKVQSLHFSRSLITQTLLHDRSRIFILERQHAAAGVLDYEDLSGAKQLLADDQGAQTFNCAATRVADDVGVAECDALNT